MDEELIEKAKLWLIKEEGFKPYPYGDKAPNQAVRGKLTIGYGRNLQANPLTRRAAMFLLEEDIARAIAEMGSIFGYGVFRSWGLPRQVAVLSMLFNMGEGGFLTFKNMVAAIQEGRWGDAAHEALDSEAARTEEPARMRRTALMLADDTFQVE